MSRLLVFSRDPGPTNQLVAVVEALKEPARGDEPEGLLLLRAALTPLAELIIASRGPGAEIWRAAGFSPVTWSGIDEEAVRSLVKDAGATAVLTGASDIDEPGDRLLWKAARAGGIQSHAVLDHPANLALRFRDEAGANIFPDWLYAPDAIFAERLAAAGIARARIRLTGDLHHKRLRGLSAGVSEEAVAQLRQLWGAARSDIVVLFPSECGKEMRAAGRSYPYDELEILVRLLKSIETGTLPGGHPIDGGSSLVVVRPHPRDLPGKYDALLSARRHAVRAVVSGQGLPHVALLAADLVVGMNSSMLYEGFELGRQVYSLTGHDPAAGKSSVG